MTGFAGAHMGSGKTTESRREVLDILRLNHYNTLVTLFRGVAKFGIALGSGPRGRGFKSRHSDHVECS